MVESKHVLCTLTLDRRNPDVFFITECPHLPKVFSITLLNMDFYVTCCYWSFVFWILGYSTEGAREVHRGGGSKQKGNRKPSSGSGGHVSDPFPPLVPYESATKLVDYLVDEKRYIKWDPPMPDRATEVRLGIYINSFYSISESTMDYQVSMYLRQSWKDPRLAYNKEVLKSRLSEIRLGHKRANAIWVPDVFFRNEKKAIFHTITVENKLLKLNSTGFIWFVTKISATLTCNMKLQKYPLDTQTCPMMFESFGYTMDTMYFSWIEKPVDIDDNVQLPQFTLVDNVTYDCSKNYTAGAFPCLEIRFVLRRDIGYFLIQVYVPSIMIVILSWVSFWINVDAIPARVSVGLLTVLTMTTQSSSANQGMPRVSYIKAIDVWMSMCLIFVFAALLEFAVVNVISRKGVRTVNPIRRAPPNLQKLDAETAVDQICMVENGEEKRTKPQRVDMEGKQKARRIDKISRKIFPFAFVLFNLVYWIIYTISYE